MAKSTILVLFALCSTILALPIEAPFDLGGPKHTYTLNLEIGEMSVQVGPFHFYVTILKQVGYHSYYSDGAHEVNEAAIFTGFSFQNYTVTTLMPFDKVDAIDIDWKDFARHRNIDDINIKHAYLTEIAPNHSNITKKYCVNKLYPRNLGGNWARDTFFLC